VGFGAAARSLAAGRRGGAGDRRRPFGPDLGSSGADLGWGGPAGLCAATRLPGGGGGATVALVVAVSQPACCSVAAGSLRAYLGPTGPVWAWYDPVAASGQLPR
jgi:hypothetical protein